MQAEHSSDSPIVKRQERLAQALAQSEFDFVALNPGPSLTYLTGLNFHLMERPVVALFGSEAAPIIILPELEIAKLERLTFPVQAFPYGEDPADWPAVFAQAIRSAEMNERTVAVEPTRLRFLELRMLESAATAAHFVSGEEIIAGLRMHKDADEVAAMRIAVKIAQNALEATLPMIKQGVSELEIASELILQLMRAGSEGEMPFSPIVSGGPNSANPHASPSDRRLQTGDLLVIDWGATYHGYISDLTRTFAIGEVEAEYQQIARIVLQANTAGRAAARPGVSAGSIDTAARQVIEAAGYGPAFFHRTGHGIGMEGHEAPYIRAGNPLVLAPGMAFTVEPGIYLTGRNGVRIEDNIVITADGAECLSDLPRELRTLA